MAWIVPIPPSPRYPYERYQVGYQDGRRQRSAGIFPTMRPMRLVAQALGRLGITNATVVGHSLGGAVASSSTRSTHPTITNQTSPHYAEALD